jgi:hypothetical protein
MHAWTATALVAALLVAGCAGSKPDAPAAPPAAAPSPPLDLSYDGTGAPVNATAALAGPLVVVAHPVGARGGEPNIGVTPKGNAFVTAGPGVWRSADHGRTWREVFNLTTAFAVIPPNDQTPAVTRSSDDMLWVDPDTGRVFADFMTSLACSNMVRSDNEGTTWQMKPLTCGLPVNDHQKVATSRYGPDTPRPANPVYPNVVYYCYNKLVSTDCGVSLDGGTTFQFDRPAAISGTGGAENQALDPCGGINGHPAPGPDGTLFVPLNLGCPGPVVAVSRDNGLSWTVRTGPTDHGAEEIDPDMTVTPDGTAYMLYRGTDHLQYLVRSKDQFATWDGPWRVSPPGVTSTVFAGITSQEDGRIAMAFLGTRDTTEEPSKAENATRWHLWTVFSYDAAANGPTFRAVQVTPPDAPVQIGCVWLGGGSNPCRNMLDFIDMSSDRDGRPMVVFSDGCSWGCDHNASATDENSHNRQVTVAVLETGPGLVAANRLEAGEVRPA